MFRRSGGYRYRRNNDLVYGYAKEMLKNPTPAEEAMWEILRKIFYQNFPDYKIYRQYVQCDHYILDFYCPRLLLGLEVDGCVHNNEASMEYDKSRDEELADNGIKVQRYSNDEVLYHPQETSAKIYELLSKRAAAIQKKSFKLDTINEENYFNSTADFDSSISEANKKPVDNSNMGSCSNCSFCGSTRLEISEDTVKCLDCGVGKYLKGKHKRASTWC